MRIEPRWTFTDVRHAAIAFGRELERRMPGEVTTKWWKEERGERVFVDYNQNARDRTIASPYSVRPKPGAPVSAPLAWDELPDVQPEDFTVETMPARFAEVGDRFATIDDVHHSLQPLLEMYERDEEGDMPYPPDYPKMPGEPKRVQPSRAKKEEGLAARPDGPAGGAEVVRSVGRLQAQRCGRARPRRSARRSPRRPAGQPGPEPERRIRRVAAPDAWRRRKCADRSAACPRA